MSYKSSVLTVSLFSDYANFKRVGPNSEEVNIYYKEISSIGCGYSADHSIFSGAYIKVNVQGYPYVFYGTEGGDIDKQICNAIQNQINKCKENEKEKAEKVTAKVLADVVKDSFEQFETTQSEHQGNSADQTVYDIYINPISIDPTLVRIQLLLEDREWEKASALCDAAINYFPDDSRIYQYALFAENHVLDFKGLTAYGFSDDKHYYEKIIRFGDESIKSQYSDIRTKEKSYQKAMEEQQRLEREKQKKEEQKRAIESDIDDYTDGY